jgi:hypothetical protein
VDLSGSENNPVVTYNITIVTGSCRGAATTANIYVQLIGEDGSTSTPQPMDGGPTSFQRSSRDKCKIRCKSVGTLEKIRVSHDGFGTSPSWLVDSVVIETGDSEQVTIAKFECVYPCWIDESCHSSKELLLRNDEPVDNLAISRCYAVETRTGMVRGAGSDANVFIRLYGERGESGQLPLEAGPSDFRKGKDTHFHVETLHIGNLTKIMVGHDNSGNSPSWYCEGITVTDKETAQTWCFNLHRWLSSEHHDRLTRIVCDVDSKPDQIDWYKVTTQTSNRRGAGTAGDVLLTVFGELGNSGEQTLESTCNDFRRGAVNEFRLQLPNLGDITAIRVRHSCVAHSWYLDFVVIEHTTSSVQYHCPCYRWAKSNDALDLIATKETTPIPASQKWQVEVKTGECRSAGTEATIYIELAGSSTSSGQQELNMSELDFVRGNNSTFIIETVELDTLKSITVSNDGSYPSSAWYCEWIEVQKCDSELKWGFRCNSWLLEGQHKKILPTVRGSLDLRMAGSTDYMIATVVRQLFPIAVFVHD